MEKIKQYFTSKFERESSHTEDECNTFLQDMELPCLTNDEGLIISRPITLVEIHKVLMSMPNSKTPGNDASQRNSFCFSLIY